MSNSIKYNTKNDIKLSKKLCKLLRHNPRGLNIKSDGYVKVLDILKLPDFKQYKAEDIISVVKDNDKQRFSLQNTGNKMLIRANQGHSINIINQEQLLTRINDPTNLPCCVHGTYIAAWNTIKTAGLDRRGIIFIWR